ncbi:uncharacterized protein LOC122265766 [Penaeus japonicus]|uniref:uncharacterized protein LOC122265766 n=1 Tax=Penaeus japonicus TaxID=27405 RepID=UPI001C70E294|nr:uncharacterized protein LOC122265766 [Penaeus japonicus]
MLLTILPGYIYKVSRARVFPVRSRTQLERAGEPLAHPKERRNAVHKATERTTAQRNPLPQASASSLQRDEMMWPRDSHSLVLRDEKFHKIARQNMKFHPQLMCTIWVLQYIFLKKFSARKSMLFTSFRR